MTSCIWQEKLKVKFYVWTLLLENYTNHQFCDFLRATDANIQYKVVKQYEMLRKNLNYMDSYLSNAVFTDRLLRHVGLFSLLIPIEGL